MAGNTNEQRILAALRDRPGLDDDELSVATGVRPRQQVNQLCRWLESRGFVRREIGFRGKIVNFLQHKTEAKHSSDAGRPATPHGVSLKDRPRHARPEQSVPRSFQCNPKTTLFVFPCSGAKDRQRSLRLQGPSILDQLPPVLRERLAEARRQVVARVHIDETSLIAAWQRYTGSLYQASRDAMETALDRGVHMIIVSGGYGLVLAAEPIGYYQAVFKASWWPGGVLEEALIEYLRQHKLRTLCAIASASTGYARLLRRVNWQLAGLDSAVLITPEETTGAMVKSPRAQGEALSRLLRGEIDLKWTSSDGLRLKCSSLIQCK